MSDLLKEAIRKTLNNEEYSDVTIITTDDNGSTHGILASKYILATRSKVFHSMFYGSFEEAKSDHVTFPNAVISYNTMQSLIHFMYTDEVQNFACGIKKKGVCFRDAFDPLEITKLFNAAHYFQMKELMRKIYIIFVEDCGDENDYDFGDIIRCSCTLVDTHIDQDLDPEEATTFLELFQQFLSRYFWDDDWINFRNPNLKVLDDNVMSPSNIPRIFNRHTISKHCITSKQKQDWLSFLYVWSKTSSEHTKGAQEAIRNIPHDLVDYHLLMEMCDDEENYFITKDIAFDMMRKRIFAATKDKENKK